MWRKPSGRLPSATTWDPQRCAQFNLAVLCQLPLWLVACRMIAGLLRVAHIHSVDVGAIENTNQINLLPLNLQDFMN